MNILTSEMISEMLSEKKESSLCHHKYNNSGLIKLLSFIRIVWPFSTEDSLIEKHFNLIKIFKINKIIWFSVYFYVTIR